MVAEKNSLFRKMIENLNTFQRAALDAKSHVTSILDMRRAGDNTYKILHNGPIYRLDSPTFHVPTKSTAFNPTIIDNSGKMHIDWNNPNIYKAIIPTVLTGSTIFGSLKNN